MSLSQPEAHNHFDVRDNGLRSAHCRRSIAPFGATSNFSSNAAVVRVITFQFARIAVSFEIEVVRVLFSSSLIRWFLPLVTHNLVRHGIYADLMCSSDKGRSPRRSEEHTSELQSRLHLVCRLLLEKKTKTFLRRIVHTSPRRCFVGTRLYNLAIFVPIFVLSASLATTVLYVTTDFTVVCALDPPAI